VNLEMKIEGVQVETAGMITVSTPRVGMEISFHKVSQETQRRIVQALQKLRQKAWDEQQVTTLPAIVAAPAQKASPALGRTDPVRELTALCKVLHANWDYWKSTCSAAEIDELRKAMAELEDMLSPARIDVHEYLAAIAPKSSGPV
jgi:hypothetical protein